MKLKKPGHKIPIGHIHFGSVNEASICYTLKYLCKPKTIKKSDKTGRQQEFSLMSKGLGKSYLTKSMVNWHKEDNRAYVHVDGNKIQSLPRYYSDKVFDEGRKEKIKESGVRIRSAKAAKVKDVQKYIKNQAERIKFIDKDQNKPKKSKI